MSRDRIALSCALVGALLCVGSAAAAFREPTPLARLVGTAEVIVVASILEANQQGLTLRIDNCVRGCCEGPSLMTILPPVRNPTEPRWVPYAPGQTVLLFLERDAERWRLAGTGGDGELPVDDRYVYFAGHFVETLQIGRYEVFGAQLVAPRYDRDAVVDALSAYAKCFEWHERTDSRITVRRLCDDPGLAAYRNRSPVHAFLAGNTEALSEPLK